MEQTSGPDRDGYEGTWGNESKQEYAFVITFQSAGNDYRQCNV